jgi:hypothetical protein
MIGILIIAIYRQAGNPVANSDPSEVYLLTFNNDTVSTVKKKLNQMD